MNGTEVQRVVELPVSFPLGVAWAALRLFGDRRGCLDVPGTERGERAYGSAWSALRRAQLLVPSGLRSQH